MPMVIWWLSFAGGVARSSYAIWPMDPVSIMGQGMELVVYALNLFLIRRAAA